MSPFFGLGSRINCPAEQIFVNDNSAIWRDSITIFFMSLAWSAQIALAADRDAALDCVDLAAADERLACFDAAYATREKSASSPPPTSAVAPAAAVVAAPPLAVITATEEEFGLPQVAGKAKTEEEFGLKQSQVETLRSRITSVERGPLDRLTFYLENGQVWKQIEDTYSLFRVRQDPAFAVITHASLGSFKLTVEGGSRSIRVKRIK
jgi:hypothetical protein